MTPVPPINTINDIFLRVASAANPRAVLRQDEAGNWHPISSDQIYQRVRALGTALIRFGIKKGDRVVLISENRWEWAVTDFAVLGIGGVVVPLYPTLTGEQLAEEARDSGARIAFVSTRQQQEKLRIYLDRTRIERVIVMDSPAPEGAIAMSDLLGDADSHGAERDPVFDALVRSAEPRDVATLIYTSGTTGEPKGVVLTHGNLAANQNVAPLDFQFDSTDASISFLPLSHATARALDYVMYNYGVQLAYCSQFDKMAQSMLQIRPTVIVGVPRVFEKIRQAVELKAAESGIKKRLLGGAINLGSRFKETVYDGRTPRAILWKMANKMVYSKVRAAFGGRLRYFVSGGAPLGLETARWFAAAGIAIWEGYGLTETSPIIALNTPLVHRMGTVGKVLPNLEVKIAEDGELLVRGPSVFSGYWHKPVETAQCFDDEGWFRTGDIGHIDADGYLHITDRKKELLKTSGGKVVAPCPIEIKLQKSYLVAYTALVGDRHKFICALISPNFAALEEWAIQQGIQAKTRAELVADARVIAQYAQVIREVNSTLANFETIKRFLVVADEWSIESGELTPSMKLKRRVLNARYAPQIAELYADESVSHGAT